MTTKTLKHCFAPVLVLLLCGTTLSSALAARVGDKRLGWPGDTLAGLPCRGNDQGFGPFDYRDPSSRVALGTGAAPLDVVERHHFTAEVEALVRGKSGSIGGDIDYTLRAFPNHHRALWARIKLHLQSLAQAKPDSVLNEGVPAPECYLNRAERFAPDDVKVQILYGIYLHKIQRYDSALERYRKAEKVAPNDAELLYNMGLLHLDRNELEQARKYAEKAYALKYPLPGLKRRLERADRLGKS